MLRRVVARTPGEGILRNLLPNCRWQSFARGQDRLLVFAGSSRYRENHSRWTGMKRQKRPTSLTSPHGTVIQICCCGPRIASIPNSCAPRSASKISGTIPRTHGAPRRISGHAHLLEVEWWPPCDFNFVFQAEKVGGGPVLIGSSVALMRQCEDLNSRTWRAERDLLGAWRREGSEHGAPLEEGRGLRLHSSEISQINPWRIDSRCFWITDHVPQVV